MELQSRIQLVPIHSKTRIIQNTYPEDTNIHAITITEQLHMTAHNTFRVKTINHNVCII